MLALATLNDILCILNDPKGKVQNNFWVVDQIFVVFISLSFCMKLAGSMTFSNCYTYNRFKHCIKF